MMHSVRYDQPGCFVAQFAEMYRQRKEVFVDRLKWNLNVKDGQEKDQFDTPDAVYLLASDGPQAELKASARLLPTTRPHLMSEIFSENCTNGAPAGPEIWEISRVCISNRVRNRAERIRLTASIAAASVEFGLHNDLRYLTFISTMVIVPHILSFGWDVKPIGEAFGRGVSKSIALKADVSEKGLRAIRENYSLPAPVLFSTSETFTLKGAA